VLFIPSYPSLTGLTGVCVTGLTGVCLLWALPRVSCLTCGSLNRGASSQFLVCLELFCYALCRVILPCRLCFGSVFVRGPREVTEAFWNTCCAAAVATSLTSAVHRSYRRRPSVRRVQHRQQAVQVSAVCVGEFRLGRLFVGS
jgi:hypothetical protein